MKVPVYEINQMTEGFRTTPTYNIYIYIYTYHIYRHVYLFH